MNQFQDGRAEGRRGFSADVQQWGVTPEFAPSHVGFPGCREGLRGPVGWTLSRARFYGVCSP